MTVTLNPPCCATCAEFNGAGCPGNSPFCTLPRDEAIERSERALSSERVWDHSNALERATLDAIDAATMTPNRKARLRNRAAFLARTIRESSTMLEGMLDLEDSQVTCITCGHPGSTHATSIDTNGSCAVEGCNCRAVSIASL